MKAQRVIIQSKGSTENVCIEEYEIPEPAENEVLIKTEYAGLSYSDLMLRAGNIPGLPQLPASPGADCVGIVVKTGLDVQGIEKGTRVAAILMSNFGGQSQYICVKKDNLVSLPDDIPSDKALCMIINYMTAYMLIESFKKKNKEAQPRILIHGGSGGVGSALIQLAKADNMKVLTTASDRNISFLQNQGVETIDYTSQRFEDYIRTQYPGKIDAVFDPIAGNYIKRSAKVIKKGGQYIAYGFQSALLKGTWGLIATMLSFFSRKIISPNLRMKLEMLINYSTDQQKSMLQQVFSLYQQGKIDPLISDVYPIEQAVEAHRQLTEGNRRGKILLKMQA